MVRLKPSNMLGAAYFAGACTTTSGGIYLASCSPIACYLIGQWLIALSVIQWFVLLHECGHRTCFRSRFYNTLGGHVAGFFTAIPFVGWRRIHNMHHKWTGWQDIDPTTASLVPRARTRIERTAANLAWKFWVPLFSLLYRYENFWNWPRMRRIFPLPSVRRGMAVNLVACAVGYVACLVWLGPIHILMCIGPGAWVGFALLDPLMLSQHTHIPLSVSQGATVKPYPAYEQVAFTRSLVFPRAISTGLLMGFDAHELHHRHPQVAGYHLYLLRGDTPNAVSAWRWVRAAKRVPAEIFLFENRDKTGLAI